MQWTFVETPYFSKRRDVHLKSDDELRRLQTELMRNPEKGDIIVQGSGIRKIRWRDPATARGKRSGLRVIYLQIPETREIVLLDVYGKGVKDDLDVAETRLLSRAAKEIKKAAIARKRRDS